jgi:DNA-binding SARP family transcriptional activator/DNA-binding beta-propeller fold protein YncE
MSVVSPPVIEYRILGPLEVSVGERRVPLGGRRQRALLAILLLTPGEVVSAERLAEGIWGDHPPPSARHLVQVYVSQLRSALDRSAAIVTRAPGYLVDIDPSCVDARRFERLVETAWDADQGPAEAVRAFDRALALWRGPALADTPLDGSAAVDVARLDALRLNAIEERIDALLALGREREVLAELERHVAAEPLRERFWAQLMLALYRAGRQADALAAYSRARRHLTEELGLEPSPALQELQQAILRHEPSLTLRPATPPAATGGGLRRRPRRRAFAGATALLAIAGLVTAALLLRSSHAPPGPTSLPARSLATIDAATGSIVGRLPLAAQPDGLAVSVDHIWVAEGQRRTLVEVDPRGLQILRTVRLTSFPYRLAAGPGRAWVGNGFAGTVTSVDARSGLASTPFRSEPHATGRLALAYGAGSLWVGSQDNALTRIDPATDRTIARVPGVIAPEALAAQPHAVWVAQATRSSVLRVDPASNRVVRSIPIGGTATAVAADSQAVWALTPSSQRIWRIDPRTNAVSAVIEIGPSASDVAVAGNSVWTMAAATGTLQRIDPRTGTIVQTIALTNPLGGIAAGHKQLWITVR